MAGIRMIASVNDSEIMIVGSDDGDHWWTVQGTFTAKDQGALIVDFSPLGGPNKVSGTYADGKITWPDGNVFSKQASGQCKQAAPDAKKQCIGGFYTDPNHYQKGTFCRHTYDLRYDWQHAKRHHHPRWHR